MLASCLMLVAAAGCEAGAPPASTLLPSRSEPAATEEERCGSPSRAGEWPLADGFVLALSPDGRLVIRGGSGTIAISDGVVGMPAVSADGARIAYSHRSGGTIGTAVSVVERRGGSWTAPRTLASEGTPDRVAISPDGRLVAFAAASNGIAALWVAGFEGGESVQITNRDLMPAGHGPPPGFVPLPYRTPPRFENGRLVWTAPDGEHEVSLP